jgi:two-component system sensor histidine kinase/response regulator
MSENRLRTRENVEILIAEDSPTQAQSLQHVLQQQGYHVTVTANGRQALEAARQRKPTIIISDVVMPEMDGYELSRQIKADPTLGDIPLILVTTLSDPQDVIRGLECCADNFILKPYDEQYLLSRVQFVLINREMRQTERVGMGVEIFFNGQKHFLSADRMQILNLLLSTYEVAIQRNRELKNSQEELRSLNAQLEGANKELESFSYSVSHDLRAPLRAIGGYAGMLRRDHAGHLEPDAVKLLGHIEENVKRMGMLIDDLLEFSRLGRKALSVQRLNLAHLTRECLKELATEQEGRKVEIVIGELPPCHGDLILVKQSLLNLLSNALKYTRKREAARIEIGGELRGDEYVAHVRDNGVGFDMRYADKLFQVFQRLHSQSEFAGTGVGLAIVKRAIEKHGGRVWAEAAPDKGATFYFSLPAGTV